MADQSHFTLQPDRRGVLWDVALYVPTVFFLGLIALKFWYSPDKQTWSYLLVFLATFFAIAGANRIFGSRLMMLPNSPLSLDVSKQGVKLQLRNGQTVDLVKELRFFSDYAGKSFGLSGMDLSGKRRQYVFHKSQFGQETTFRDAKSLLSVFR